MKLIACVVLVYGLFRLFTCHVGQHAAGNKQHDTDMDDEPTDP